MRPRAYVFYHQPSGSLGLFVEESRGFFWKNGIEWSETAWSSIGWVNVGYFGKWTEQ